MRPIAALCSVSAIAMTVPAYGQTAARENRATEAEVDSSDPSDVIIVSARRRDEDVQDVPLVVSTVTSQSIEKLNLQNFTEVQGLVPGLQLSTAATGVGASAQIRGVTFDINASTQPSVEFYFNDAPITASYVLQQMYDVEQIEVLRGPQGTLRGRSSPSGSITVTTKRPDLQDFGGNISMSGNDIGGLNFKGAIGIPVIKDVLAVRAAGVWDESEANRVRTVNSGLDGRDPHAQTGGGRVSALFQPVDWLRLSGVYQRTDTNYRQYDQYASYELVNPAAPASPQMITPRDRLSIKESPTDADQRFDLYNWRAEARFGGQALIYQGQYADSHIVSVNNDDAANFFAGFDNTSTIDSNSDTTSHEIRLQNEDRIFGMFDYVLGYFNLKQDSATSILSETPIALPPFAGGGLAAVSPITIQTGQIIKESSVFGNLTAYLGENVRLSGGLRYIHLKSPANNLTLSGPGFTSALPGAIEVDDKKLIYSATAQYFVSPDVMVYAGTGTSYRPGPTIVGNYSLAQSDRQREFTFLKAETSTSYEFGIKSSLLDKRLRLNVTGYHQKFKNYPYKLTGPVYFQDFFFNTVTGVVEPRVTPLAQFGASVPVEVNGVEAEIAFKVTPQFDVGLVASYSLGKIKNGAVPCDDINQDGIPDILTTAPTLDQVQTAYGANYVGACQVNQRSSNQAPFSATVQAEYFLPVSSKADFFARGLFTFLGDSLNDPTNLYDDLGSYGILNLFAGVRDPNGAWEVNLFAKNVLNKTVATSFQRSATTGYQELQPPTFQTTIGRTASSPYSIITTNAPREFGLNFRFAFGSR